MKVLNLLTAGNIGGIECLCRDIGLYSNYVNGFCFLFDKGDIYDDMLIKKLVTYDLTNFKRKINLSRYLQLRRIAKEYDIITVHHGDAFFEVLSLAIGEDNEKEICDSGALLLFEWTSSEKT